MTQIIHEIILSDTQKGSGKTRHHRDGTFVTHHISKLQVVSFDGDDGVYVLYLDENNNELNDLYFDSLEEANRHIAWEFSTE